MNSLLNSDLALAPFIRDADFAVRRPWNVAQRRLLDYLLVYVQEGRCRFQIESENHDLVPGDFCLIQPGQSIFLEGLTATVTPYAHFDLVFNPRRDESFATRPGQMNLTPYSHLLQPDLKALGASIPPVFHPPSSEETVKVWLRVVHDWNAGGNWERIEANHHLGSLILSWMREFRSERSAAPPFAALSWIPSYLSTHLSDPISVAQLAARARLSPSRFHAVFRQNFGVPPGQYLMEMRVRHAAELLLTTSWKLAQIARICGFADVHHFAKSFKRHFGKTPGQHRIQNITPTLLKPQ